MPTSSSLKRVIELLEDLDEDYIPILSSIVNINEYATKLLNNASIYVAHEGQRDIGFIAIYLNDHVSRCAFISSIGTRRDVRGLGVGMALLEEAHNVAVLNDMNAISLEVSKLNISAIKLYKKLGYVEESEMNSGTYVDAICMIKYLGE